MSQFHGFPDTKLQRHLEAVKACYMARKWVGEKTPEQAWLLCERADWLLWEIITLNVDKRLILETSYNCANLTMPFVINKDDIKLADVSIIDDIISCIIYNSGKIDITPRSELLLHKLLCSLIRATIPFSELTFSGLPEEKLQ